MTAHHLMYSKHLFSEVCVPIFIESKEIKSMGKNGLPKGFTFTGQLGGLTLMFLIPIQNSLSIIS